MNKILKLKFNEYLIYKNWKIVNKTINDISQWEAL